MSGPGPFVVITASAEGSGDGAAPQERAMRRTGPAHPVARSGAELLQRLPARPDPEGLVLLGDRWLRWPDRRGQGLGARLSAWLGDAPLGLVTSGRVYRQGAAARAARGLGITRVTVELPAAWFRPGVAPGRVGEALQGATRLNREGLAVRLCVAVDRYSRGLLDELALEAARAGAVAFEPGWSAQARGARSPARSDGPDRPDHARRARGARARFDRLRGRRWPAGPERRDLFLVPWRALPDFVPERCAWRRAGWPGPEGADRAAILCPPGGVPVLYTVEGDEWREPGAREPGAREPGAREPGAREPGARDPETLEPAAVALRKHALGQTWWAPPGDTPHRSLAPHPRCEACLQRLRCPTAFVPRDREDASEDRDGPGARSAPPPGPARAARDADAGPVALAAALERLAPGQTLVVTGRVGRVVLRGDPAAAEAAAGAGASASASASESAVELEDARDVAGEQAAADATDVVDPQWVADLARVHGVEVSRYALAGGPPPDGVPDGYWLELRRPEIAAPPGPRPGQALLMVCNVCVTRCLMCGLPDLFDRAYLSPAHALRWLAELRLLGTLRVDLFGGEVTLRPDLLSLADFARHRGLRTSFITTGYQLDEAWVDELAASDVDQVEVALDGDRAEIHNPIKGGLEAFDDAVALVRRLAEDGGRVVDVNTVILAENLGRLPAIVELVADLGADEHRLFSCVRFPLAPGLQEPLGPAEVRRIWEQDVPEARRRAAARGLAFEVCGAVDPTAADRDAAFAAFAAGAPNPLPRRGWRCGAPRHERSLLIDGTVLPCQNPSFYVDLLERPGNALRQWLWEVLASPRFAELAAGAGLWESCGRCICYRDAGDRDGGGGDEAGR